MGNYSPPPCGMSLERSFAVLSSGAGLVLEALKGNEHNHNWAIVAGLCGFTGLVIELGYQVNLKLKSKDSNFDSRDE